MLVIISNPPVGQTPRLPIGDGFYFSTDWMLEVYHPGKLIGTSPRENWSQSREPSIENLLSSELVSVILSGVVW